MCEENLMFYDAAQVYKENPALKEAAVIWSRYFFEASPLQINIKSMTTKTIMINMKKLNMEREPEVLNLMEAVNAKERFAGADETTEDGIGLAPRLQGDNEIVLCNLFDDAQKQVLENLGSEVYPRFRREFAAFYPSDLLSWHKKELIQSPTLVLIFFDAFDEVYD